MKITYQKAHLLFNQVGYWLAQKTGNLEWEHEAMKNSVMLRTQLRVAQAQEANNHLFTNTK